MRVRLLFYFSGCLIPVINSQGKWVTTFMFELTIKIFCGRLILCGFVLFSRTLNVFWWGFILLKKWTEPLFILLGFLSCWNQIKFYFREDFARTEIMLAFFTRVLVFGFIFVRNPVKTVNAVICCKKRRDCSECGEKNI